MLLYTDASIEGLGRVLAQQDEDGKEHPIDYLSRSLSPAEKKSRMPGHRLVNQEATSLYQWDQVHSNHRSLSSPMALRLQGSKQETLPMVSRASTFQQLHGRQVPRGQEARQRRSTP